MRNRRNRAIERKANENLQGNSISSRLFFAGEFKKVNVEKLLKYWDFANSDFYEKVYRVIVKIPAGETLSYQEVAEKAGSPKASRAVGNAMKNNRFGLLIP